MSSESDFFEFVGGQHTNFIFNLFKIFSLANFLLRMEMEANYLSFFGEEMQQHHSHRSDRISPKVADYQIQNVATNVEPLCYR